MVSEALARPTRTALQGIIATAIVEFLDAFLLNMNGRQYAAALALLTLIVGGVQVLVENRTGKAVLRTVPPKLAPFLDSEGNASCGANLIGGDTMKHAKHDRRSQLGHYAGGPYGIVAVVVVILLLFILLAVVGVI